MKPTYATLVRALRELIEITPRWRGALIREAHHLLALTTPPPEPTITLTLAQAQEIEWSARTGPDDVGCPACRADANTADPKAGRWVGTHAPDCWLAAAIAAVSETRS